MTGKDRGGRDHEQSPTSEPWHNRTPAVVGASAAGIAVIGLLIVAGTFVARQFNEPAQAPLNFVTPSFSASASDSSSTPMTTPTVTSTSPPVTTDIDGPSSTTSPSSGVNTSSVDLEDPSHTAWTKPYTPSSASGSTPTTSQRGPRFNVSRTGNP